MINVKEVYKKFNEFIKKYNLEDEMVKLKIAHMIRVMDINMQFAKWQNQDEENVQLAGTIGLLHDIGRFVQIEKYHTFIDAESVDHCQAGVELLFSSNLIEFFVKDQKYYYIIEKAIANHGKMEIEQGLDEKTLLHCELIRDSDKTDIYEIMLRENPDTVFDGVYKPDIKMNLKIVDDFYNHKMIKKTEMKTVLDDYVRKIAFIYNYYFDENLKYIKEKDYINKMTERFLEHFKINDVETLVKIESIKNYANKYINKK